MIARRKREQEALDLLKAQPPEVLQQVVSTDNRAANITIEVALPPPDDGMARSSGTDSPRLAKIYCCPNNKRMRLIEFQDDRSHGHLFVQQSAPPMLNWVVWVKPDGGGHWILQGSYNSRGVRVR